MEQLPGAHAGRAVQVDPMKPTLKAPVSKRLTLKHDGLLSSFAFNFSLRCYMLATAGETALMPVAGVAAGGVTKFAALIASMVGRCRLKPPFASTE